MTSTLEWLPNDLHNTQAINPLVGCAAPLLLVAHQLIEQTEPINEPKKLLDSLLDECKHFYDKANQHGYSTRHILATRYWLCVILDEVIQGLPNPNKYQYLSLSAALNHSSKEHFFAILEQQRFAAKPDADVLELAYLCLLFYRPDEEVDPTRIQAALLSQTQKIRQHSITNKIKTKRSITRPIISAVITLTLLSSLMIYAKIHAKLNALHQNLPELISKQDTNEYRKA